MSEVSPKELEFTLRVRNNRLKQRRAALGMSQPQFAKAAGVVLGAYCGLETMKLSPQHKDGSWRDIVLSLSAFHAVEPEELFPPAVLAVAEPVVVRKVDGLDLRELMSMHQQRLLERPDEVYDRVDASKQIARSLATLTPREEEVIRLRFGLDGGGTWTLEEIAEIFGVQGERIRQVEAKGLRKLRHPERAKKLEPFMPDGKGKKAMQEAIARLESVREAERGRYLRNAKARWIDREETWQRVRREYHHRLQGEDKP